MSATSSSPGARATFSWCRVGTGISTTPMRNRCCLASRTARCRKNSICGAKTGGITRLGEILWCASTSNTAIEAKSSWQTYSWMPRPSRGKANLRSLGLRRFFRQERLLVGFADRRHRQAGAELDEVGTLDRRDFVLDEIAQLIFGDGLAGARLHHRLHGLAAIRVGYADDNGLRHFRVLVERLLDEARIDLIARGDDDILDAVDDEEIAVRIEITDIAGVEASARHRVRGL